MPHRLAGKVGGWVTYTGVLRAAGKGLVLGPGAAARPGWGLGRKGVCIAWAI